MKIDKDSYAYQKYLRKYDKYAPENIEKRKKEKANRRKEWWKNNWGSVVGAIIGIVTLIITIWLGLCSSQQKWQQNEKLSQVSFECQKAV